MGFDRFESAVLVVAHPDDEALWFSSVVRRVSRVVIAYEACDELPDLAEGRRAAASDYPLTTAAFLRRPEPCSLGHVDWDNPEPTDYGMALNGLGSRDADVRYRNAFEVLRDDLLTFVSGASDVFTHNPWGEYGHPDHVQLSRVVTTLGAELGFRTHFSSYVSPRSMRLASKFIPSLRTAAVLETDRSFAERLKAKYVEHGCWTWHDAYVPPASEAFLIQAESRATEADTLPLTCLMTT